MLILIERILIVIICVVAPMYAFIKVSRYSHGQLRNMLFTVSYALLFLAFYHVLRLFYFDNSFYLFFYYATHIIGDIFAIKAVIEFRRYSKMISFK